MTNIEKTFELELSPAIEEWATGEGLDLVPDRIALDALAARLGAKVPRKFYLGVEHATRDFMLPGRPHSRQQLEEMLGSEHTLTITASSLKEADLTMAIAHELYNDIEYNPDMEAWVTRMRRVVIGGAAVGVAGGCALVAGRMMENEHFTHAGGGTLLLGAGVLGGAMVASMKRYLKPFKTDEFAGLRSPIQVRQTAL